MKTDSELVELAAKAAGMVLTYLPEQVGECAVYRNADGGETNWTPLTDDGDALRLAVKLEMMVDTVNRVVAGYTSSITIEIGFDDLGNDPCAANRRAIVLAAAAEGEAV